MIADILDKENIQEFGKDLFLEEKLRNKDEYLKHIRTDGYYLGGIVLEIIAKKTGIIFGIFLEDERYEDKPWITIAPEGEKYNGVILLHLNQGPNCQNGHYSGIRLFNNHSLGNIRIQSFKSNTEENINYQMRDKTTLKIMIMNTRSIKDYIKRLLIIDLLRSKEIDIACIQETFLIKDDPLYFEGYKIFRDENNTKRRKGVLILISKKLDIETQRVAADPNGRSVKVRIKNRRNDDSMTISSVYLEPNGDIEDINHIIFESDVIAGDMNNANSGIQSKGVFHYKNIEIKDIIEFKENKMFDHPILFGEIKFGTYVVNENNTCKILDREVVNNNHRILNEIIHGYESKGQLMNPIKVIQTKINEEHYDIIKFGEDFTRLKNKIKIKNKIEWNERYKNINSILTLNQLNTENWARINSTLLKKKAKIWKKNSNAHLIVEDFKKLYGNDENRIYDVNKVLQNTKNIFDFLTKNKELSINYKLFEPKSKAQDYFGFTQNMLIKAIKGDSIDNTIIKFTYIIEVLSNNDCISTFIHNYIKVLLIKKKDEADSYKDLRPIAILPAWLITLEKIAKNAVNKIISPKITENQFGFKEGFDCNIAKTMIYFKCKKFKYNKALLIDIRKAYDSVNREKLKQIIINKFNKEDYQFLLNFISIYEKLTMIINDEEINNVRGLPQGSSLSPVFLNAYINDALVELNKIKWISAQAYADDLIIQSNDIKSIQIAFDKTKELYKNLDLIINGDKCQLLSDNQNDKIIDNEQKININSIDEAKYLGQIINNNGIPDSKISNSQLGPLLNKISKVGTLTRTAKIKIFKIYMKSKINHLIPLISITGGLKELWKSLRHIIFKYLIEFSTLPRESASAFGLGYYEVILRPVMKLRKRSKININNADEDELLKEGIKEIMKQWLVSEPKHTDEIKTRIIKNTNNEIEDSFEEFDKLLALESFNRLYKGHEINLEESQKLRIINSPGLIVLISNEPIHELKQRIKLVLKKNDEKEYRKIKNILNKLYTIKEYAETNDDYIEEQIKVNTEDIELDCIIKEIKIKEKWKTIKNRIKDKAEAKLKEIINNNKNKENTEVKDVDDMIGFLRKLLSKCDKELIREIEVGIELDNLEDIKEEIKLSNNKKERRNRPGRPKKEKGMNNNQYLIDIFLSKKDN